MEITALELQRLEFAKYGPEKDLSRDASVELGLEIAAPQGRKLALKITVAFEVPERFRISATYGAVFRAHEALLGDSPEDRWREIVAQLGPRTLYPYIRETITAVTQKAGYPPVVPAILNFGELFSPDEIVFPHEEGSAPVG